MSLKVSRIHCAEKKEIHSCQKIIREISSLVVWQNTEKKFKQFSSTKILREINLGELETNEIVIFDNFRGSVLISLLFNVYTFSKLRSTKIEIHVKNQ